MSSKAILRKTSGARALVWVERFRELKKYRHHTGNCDVPKVYKPNQPLSDWLWHQRKLERRGDLDSERKQLLEGAGVTWSTDNKQVWECMLAKSAKLKKLHGDCNVPRDYKADRELAIWQHTQRNAKRTKRLSKERIGKLDKIGFRWNLQNDQWDDMFTGRLKPYKSKNGSCDVPYPYKDDPELGAWCHNQRVAYQKGLLRNDRQEKLLRVGFSLEPLEDHWDEMFDRLERFFKKTGRTNVPQRYKQDPELGRWVNWQRQRYKLRTLTMTQRKRLRSIGFKFILLKRKSSIK